jgi:hypothetical protein
MLWKYPAPSGEYMIIGLPLKSPSASDGFTSSGSPDGSAATSGSPSTFSVPNSLRSIGGRTKPTSIRPVSSASTCSPVTISRRVRSMFGSCERDIMISRGMKL